MIVRRALGLVVTSLFAMTGLEKAAAGNQIVDPIVSMTRRRLTYDPVVHVRTLEMRRRRFRPRYGLSHYHCNEHRCGSK